jgi:competence protein ComEC
MGHLNVVAIKVDIDVLTYARFVQTLRFKSVFFQIIHMIKSILAHTNASWPRFRLQMRQITHAIVEALHREQEHLTPFVWLPVAFGLGILAYFSLHYEPSLWVGSVITTASVAAVLICPSERIIFRTLLIAITAVSLGFIASIIRTHWVAQPLLTRTHIGSLTGFVETVEQRPQGPRLVIRVDAFSGLPHSQRPLRVRVSVREGARVKAGDYIFATARFLPLPEAPRPGGYDFARDAFFKGYGSVGSLVGAVTILPTPDDLEWMSHFTAWVDRGRNALTERIANAFGGQEGAVTAALVTGKRGLITEETNNALRGAGIYHIISISGLHMVLAAGAIFASLRAFLALLPFLALGWPIKKIAASGAMLGATVYCIFSGSDVATERSLIMTLVIFGAILVDRPALSLRNLAISALIVLARQPESLLSPSFQMSFAAVAGLIAFAVHIQNKPPDITGIPVLSWFRRWGNHFVWATMLLIITTVIATLATAPFSVYHFQTLNPLGIIGNALALPFISLIVMPGAVLGVTLYPVGLDLPIWWGMGVAVKYVLIIAAWIASFENASVVIPAISGVALLCFVLALLMSTLLKTFLRWSAILPLIVGYILAYQALTWDILIDRDGQGAAVKGADGHLIMMGRPSGFVKEQWLKASGDSRKLNDKTLTKNLNCDHLGCTLTTVSGHVVSYINRREAFADDCKRAHVIITNVYAPSYCIGEHIFDRKRLSNTGSVAIKLHKSTSSAPQAVIAQLETSRTINGQREKVLLRPWMRPLQVRKAINPIP